MSRTKHELQQDIYKENKCWNMLRKIGCLPLNYIQMHYFPTSLSLLLSYTKVPLPQEQSIPSGNDFPTGITKYKINSSNISSRISDQISIAQVIIQ